MSIQSARVYNTAIFELNLKEAAMLRRVGFAIGLIISASGIALAETPAADTKSASPAQSDDLPNMLPPAVGDHWTYELRDNITGNLTGNVTQTITDIKGDEINVQNQVLGAAGTGLLVFDRLWNLKNNNLIWKYAPNDGTGIKEPLKIGESWDIKTSDSKESRTLWKRTGKSKVVAEESVTTQAGTFTALKIEVSIRLNSVINPAQKSNFQVTNWYVPSVNHWVKRTEKLSSDGHVLRNTTIELADFGRQ